MAIERDTEMARIDCSCSTLIVLLPQHDGPLAAKTCAAGLGKSGSGPLHAGPQPRATPSYTDDHYTMVAIAADTHPALSKSKSHRDARAHPLTFLSGDPGKSVKGADGIATSTSSTVQATGGADLLPHELGLSGLAPKYADNHNWASR
jgi:hypothetical protein